MTTGRDITDALVMGVKQALYECSGGDFEATDREARAIAERLRDEFADALRAEVARLTKANADVSEELSAVLGDWNAFVAAIGSPTHGGAVGHARALRERAEKAEAELAAIEHQLDQLEPMLDKAKQIQERVLLTQAAHLAQLEQLMAGLERMKVERDALQARAERAEAEAAALRDERDGMRQALRLISETVRRKPIADDCIQWMSWETLPLRAAAVVKALDEAKTEAAALRADAERGRWIIRHSGWERRDDCTGRYAKLVVRLPYEADLSCVATREHAIDAARAREADRG